jgi:hypothetical protein
MSTQFDLTRTSKVSIRKLAADGTFSEDKSTLRFYTIETISPHRSYTPEGYLLCEGATLSRTGQMLYKADEVPVSPGKDGLVTVVRYDEDVFRPESIASANGKSVCNNHPAEGQDITPENWRSLEVGVILHPRRGTGDKKDCLVADLLIKDKEAIKLIESGKVQLSCGYDADYEELKPGYAKQTGIIINHVAIVENGRCGPRCAIMDEDALRLNKSTPSGDAAPGKHQMARNLSTSLGNLKAALNRRTSTKDSDMANEEPDNEILALALEGLNNRLANIEKRLKIQDRRPRDDDDEYESRDRRDARRRDDNDDDNDDDRRSRDRYHHNDRYSRDDDDRRSRDRRDARRRDSEEEYESRDRRDARRRGSEEEYESRDRRDARRRDDDDDDDAHFTDRKRRDENELEIEAGEKNKDRARKSKDSAFLEDSWNETIALAECLLPGVAAPKFTRDSKPVDTMQTLCTFRKSVLATKFTSPEGRQLILDLNRGETPDFQGMSCAAARTLFRDCAIVAKRTNNTKSATQDNTAFGIVKINNPVIGDPTAYNQWAAKHWESKYGPDDVIRSRQSN